jgi:hypothetical protein
MEYGTEAVIRTSLGASLSKANEAMVSDVGALRKVD